MSVPTSPSHEDGKDSPAASKSTEDQQQQDQQQQKPSSEEIMIHTAYNDTKKLLQTPSGVLDTVSSIVTLRNAVEDPPAQNDETGDARYQIQYANNNLSLLTPNRGHHAIARALEKLEHLEKAEGDLQLATPLTTELTKIATGDDHYASPKDAVATLEALSQSVPRRVCQHPFKKNDIVWVCRTCQADETCVLCHNCFKQSNHEGHDVAFYHAQAGGCCDCGDPDAWDPAGFCPHHGPASHQSCFSADGRLGPLSGSVVHRVQGVVPAVVDWMVETVAHFAEEGHERTEEVDADTQQARMEGAASGTASTHNTADEDASGGVAMAESQPSIFSPSAAGSSRSRRGIEAAPTLTSLNVSSPPPAKKSSLEYTKTEKLGFLARQGGGLYLILRSDDINTLPQIVDALRELFGTSSLYTESILQKVVRSLKNYGQLIVWGTMELLAELSSTQVQLWLDGDRVASGALGSAMLKRAKILTSHGMFCSILTRRELEIEQRSVVALQWLTGLARSCDPLCQKVAEAIAPDRHLVPLLRSDFKLSSRITKYWHSLLLTLLAVPTFKSHLAAAYCDTYQAVTAEYARGMGVLERSGYALSVQFLNRVTYVVDLVERRDLLGKLGASLFETLVVAAGPATSRQTMTVGTVTRTVTAAADPSDQRQRLDPNHFVLTHRRYSPCISDLKCVLNVKGMPRLFASKSGSFLKDWVASLALGQMMDSQIWRDWTEGHVELESRGWVGAFNASISLGSLFERLLSWDDNVPSPIQDPNSPLSSNLLTCVELSYHVLCDGILNWQHLEMSTYEATAYTTSLEPYKKRTASLPFSTLSVKTGSVLAFRALPVAQVTPFSFHLPLHRFVAACLREAALRQTGIEDLQVMLSQRLTPQVHDDLHIGLMEFPLLVLSRAAQVRAGLWRRNGNGLNDQVLNYAEPPFCRAMRDADLLLVQFAMLGRIRHQTTDLRSDYSGSCFMIHLLLHRLGLFDFCGLAKAPDADVNRYLDEVDKGLYFAEKGSEEAGDEFLLPSTYSPAKDAGACLLLLEEFLHTMIILCSELPGLPPKDKSDHTSQAKWRLQREVIHRLASGPKTHSELAEVHHVLSHWDNVFLSEEGKLVNPDDATGAALGSVLGDVATRKISRGKMEPDKWELTRNAWESYDPSFYHINARNHQTSAEFRPGLANDSKYRVKPKPFCPPLPAAHSAFSRLRRDITADSTLLAISYRTLHTHIRDNRKKKETKELRGAMAYEGNERSETALARAVHVLTLGAFSWKDAAANDMEWRKKGGGSVGSVFFDRSDDGPAPTAKSWISAALLANPRLQQSSEWYGGEENCLQLLRRLAVDGGYDGCFVAQDKAVQAGAAWLCEFAADNSPEACKLVRLKDEVPAADDSAKQETELERRKRIAKEKAMERMKAQAAKFASMMQAEMGDDEDSKADKDSSSFPEMERQGSFASGASIASTSDSDKATPISSEGKHALFEDGLIPPRLLKCRPQCIICSDDGNAERQRVPDEGHRKSRRRRNDGGNALSFVGYSQASTVMKGGGGPPSSLNVCSVFSPVRRFVGAHTALCGHAIHSDCWESYLATVSHREDRVVGKRDEFRCPLCQRLSNCLVPFIDVGADWIEPASSSGSTAMDVSTSRSEDGIAGDSMSCDTMDLHGPMSLNDFLTSTPWWVARQNQTVIWDGQSAFVSKLPPPEEEEPNTMEISSPRRRSVRGLRKKDLYEAWKAMMKTPRFLKRRMRSTQETTPGAASDVARAPDSAGSRTASSSSESTGEMNVWRRFMDQVSDITYRSDAKRLGEENLHNDFGEFRHYISEKYAYNMANRFAGAETTDWPSCVFPELLTDTKRQELSREKILSKLMMSIQAFTYTTCSEANEARRLTSKIKVTDIPSAAAMPPPSTDEQDIRSIFSKYGISNIVCNGKVIVMPRPSAGEDDGTQPFNGRLGRLRYLGLAVMAAAGAVAADLVQLVLAFPLKLPSGTANQPYRAPIVYPILYGHIMTHVVAAICASAGRARARSDALEVSWPATFSSKGSFVVSGDSSSGLPKHIDSVVEDSEGFIKLGLLARVLQVLLGKIDILALNNIAGLDTEFVVLKTLQKIRANASPGVSVESRWTMNCLTLLEVALSNHKKEVEGPSFSHVEDAVLDRFRDGCTLAVEVAAAFIADIIVILQLVVPGVMERYPIASALGEAQEERSSFEVWSQFESVFQLESFSHMLESEVVCKVVANWYDTSRSHIKSSVLPSATMSGSGGIVTSRLFQTQGYRVFDWPMESCRDVIASERFATGVTGNGDLAANADGVTGSNAMEVDSDDDAKSDRSGPKPSASPSVVTFNSKRSVPLIGGFASEIPVLNSGGPRIAVVPSSYTDLYAELGMLLPESEQTAVCLICGEVLNAGGKGECTRHSYKCGAGTGMFFLLQECTGLIMHNGKAAYIHSPYVDSHGETPQYRGRPLNLDLDRYDHLHEVWSGHSIRQQVLAERGTSRQIIVPDFY
ncbi:MAG: hypothetical protein SGILL_002291 [Bacillariaceae sp.]